MSLLPVGVVPSVGGYNINNSLRLRASANAQLTRTPTTSSNRTTWTFSAWIKRGALVDGQSFFGVTTSGSDNTQLRFSEGTGLLNLRNEVGGTALIDIVTTSRVFRDPSAWYHIIIVFDSTNATEANRCVMYVNGESQTLSNVSGNIALNETTYINSTVLHSIGDSSQNSTVDFDGYLAEVHFVDGQALTPTSFGETNATTGVWQPKAYTGTYGTNGFYLKFSDATIGTPTLINTTTAVQNTNSTTITVNVPAGTTNNDLMILLVCSGSGTNTWTTPSGWTLWSPTTNANGRAIYYRTASSEPASYTITQSGSTTSDAYILTYRNAAIDVMGTFPTSAANPAIAPSITTTENNAVVFFYIASPNVSSCTYTTPTNFTPLVSESDATTPSSAIFTRIQATAGATGTASSTASSGLPRAIQFSIKPASTNLGKDFSGNNNLWATNNISITSDVTYDSMTDSPTLTSATVSNYPVINPLYVTASTQTPIINGNLSANNSAAVSSGCVCSLPVDNGKWYWEVNVQTMGASMQIGVIPTGMTTSLGKTSTGIYAYHSGGTKYVNGVSSSYGASYTAGDTIGMTYDSSTGILTAYKNNASQGTLTTLTTTTSYIPYLGFDNGGAQLAHINFGQRPFTYTPPTGYVALNTYNLPDSTIVKGNSYMDATTYTGNGASPRSITNAASFRPDFVWIKNRTSGTIWHILSDSNRGANRNLFSNSTNAEAVSDANGWLSAFNSNGFSIVTGTTITNVNANGDNYVAWQWQAGSSTVTNTSGTISAQVRANTTTGFSIVTYTGNGSATASVGHGLGVAPKVVIIKARSTTGNWAVYTSAVDGSWDILNLNTTAAKSDSSAAAPTSSVFNLITTGSWNTNAVTYVAYCWAEIAGFSRFGSYTGNGSTNGTFVYLGFRPKFVMIKVTSTTNDWGMYDSTRNLTNLAGLVLRPNTSGAEVSASNIDFLSNGFKLRNNAATTEYNGNGSTYIYAAFAENPFKNALAR